MSKETLKPEEIEDLRKSLVTLGMSEEEIETIIEKSMKDSIEKEDNGEQKTVEELAKEGKKEEKEEGGEKKENEEGEKEEETEEIKKSKAKERYDILKAEMGEIEKSFPGLCEGKSESKGDDIKKSIEDSISEYNQGTVAQMFAEFKKSMSSEISELKEEYEDIIKGLKDEIKTIGDTPVGMKSILRGGKVNFFEKSIGTDLEDTSDSKVMSISRDKEDIIKSLQSTLDEETDEQTKQMLQDGISDFTVNSTPTSHGARALAYVSRKKNITLQA